ncbi:MAG TPA: hypothetical protein VFE30_10190 [Anaeromyxobacteraceae bacterium]|jgi:hypothetical protein|nr:hypothetical protein [Anaeromyxobacteraceae bacterium]
MPKGKIYSDYGSKLLSSGKPPKMASLDPFTVNRVARPAPQVVRLLGTVLVDNERLAVTADVPAFAVSQFLDSSAPPVAVALRRFLEERFTKPDSIELTQPVTVQVVAKVGAELEPAGCVPFKALSIAPRATPPASEEVAPPEPEPVLIDPDQELIVLQLSPDIGDIVPGLGLPGIVTTVLLQCVSAATPPKGKQGWTAYIGSRSHYQQLTLWVGLSSNFPLDLVSTIQERFELMGTEVGREMSTPRREELAPLLRVAGREVFVLVPEDRAPWMKAAVALSGVVPRQGVPEVES